MSYRRIIVEGAPEERGRQYGAAARAEVARSVAAYTRVFSTMAGWDWDRVVTQAAGYVGVIEAYCRSYMDEMRGIAHGAGVDPLDILALNVRTEILYAAVARDAVERGLAESLPHECSSLAVLPSRGKDGHVLIAENWDWLRHAAETTVVVEHRQDRGPNFVTVVEGGLLAKCGMNSAGLGIVVNALNHATDQGAFDVPFHVLIRAIFDCQTAAEAINALARARRASSANFLVAHRDGLAIDAEVIAGDATKIWLGYGTDGVILHTNHFINVGHEPGDMSMLTMSGSPMRLVDLMEGSRAPDAASLDPDGVMRLLSRHNGYPMSVCCHGDPSLPAAEQSVTLASVVMDLTERRMWLASGTPCEVPYEELELSSLR